MKQAWNQTYGTPGRGGGVRKKYRPPPQKKDYTFTLLVKQLLFQKSKRVGSLEVTLVFKICLLQEKVYINVSKIAKKTISDIAKVDVND